MPQTLTALAGIVSVLLVAAGLFYTNLNADRQQKANLDQQKLVERGQVTDRFGKAIDQLGQEGDDKVSIRLGGIYALQRLMRDSADDEPAIIQVLCAFVRTHAPAPATSNAQKANPVSHPKAHLDVTAAVSVLAHRPDPEQSQNQRIDFTGTQLAMADLADAHLTHAELGGTDLTGADLTHTHLTDAYLEGADLTYANLDGADLTYANLQDANLTRAILDDANLTGAYQSRANLTEAGLMLANLTRANLTDANLTRAYLDGANLTDAHLTHANLTGAHLTQAYLTDAYLTGADLTGADLTGADGLSTESIRCAEVAPETKLPSHVGRPIPHAPTEDPACRT